MPRSHLFPSKLRFVLMLLALAGPLLFTTWQAGAQKKKAAPRASATPAATPQTSGSQTTPKSQQKINLVRMRSSDTADGSSVSLESDGVMNKYSAYRKEDRFYVVVPELDAQRAQSNLRGRGFQNVQVQKNGNETVLVFRLQPGAKASVRQRFNRLDVVFSTPGGAGAATGANPDNSGQTQAGTSTTRTPPVQPQNGTTTAPNSARPSGVDTNPSTTNQSPVVTPYMPGPAPAATVPTPTGAQPATPIESPAANTDAPPPPDQIAQAQNPPASQPPTNISQQPLTTSPSLVTTLARNWWLALIVGLVLVSLGLVVAARAKSRRSQPEETVKEKESLIEEKPAKVTATPKLKVAPVATAAATTAAIATAAKKSDKEKERAPEKKAESAFKESSAKEITVAGKSATKEAASVTMADIESASVESKKLLAGEAYDEAIVGSSERGTRQAVAAELLAALASRNVERRERARVAFVKHNYVDEATHDLRTADAPGERAAAARALGLSQDKTATPHLIAALEDDSPEVRRAVIEALAELRDPVAVAPLEALLKSEHDRKVPHSLIRRAIEVSAVVAAVAAENKAETTTIEAAAPVVDAQEETPTLETSAPAVKEEAAALSAVKDETQTIEVSPIEAATTATKVATETEKPATTETAVVVSEASQLSLTDAPAIETPAVGFVPPGIGAVAPQQRTDNRKKRKKQARLKKAEEQTRKLAELEAARQKEQESTARRQQEDAARRAAEAEAARLLVEEQERERAREEEARRQAEAEERRLEAEAQQKAQQEAAAREQAEAEARRLAEEEAQRKIEEEAARQRVEEEARARAEEEARLRAQVEARQRAEAEARKKAEEEAARRQAEEQLRQAEEERRIEEERRRVEEERRQAEEARQRAEAEQRAAAEAARIEAEAAAAKLRAVEEARRQAEAEERRRAEEERQRQEAEAERKRAEAEAVRQRAEAEKRAEEERQQAEARLRAAEEAARQREAEAARRRSEEEARQRAEEEAHRRAEEEAARALAAEKARQRAEAEARLREEEARQREEEAARRAAEEAETIHVSEADVITGTEPASIVEPLIERNDGSNVGWFDIDVSQTDVSSSSNAPVELSAVDDLPSVMDIAQESSITEWHMTPSQPATHESAASSIELVEEAVVEAPKEIGLEAPKEIEPAVLEKGIAEQEDEFSTVPNSILRRLGSEDSEERAEAVADLGRLGGEDAFREISAAFDDPVQEVRNAAARSLFGLSTDRAASFTRALREAPVERRRSIGAALASSGLASEAIGHLMGESREKTYDAFSLLFLMSKAGEVQPLMRAIEEHPNNEVRLAVVKLLALSGQQEILPAFRRLAVRGSLPTEVRSAVMEAIYQISSQSPSDASSRV